MGALLPPDAADPHGNADNNQKLGLIKALLEVGAWDAARVMLNRLPPKHATAYGPLADAFCQLIHACVEPLYRKHSGMATVLKSPPKVMLASGIPCPEELRVHNWPDFGRRLLPMTQVRKTDFSEGRKWFCVGLSVS